MEREAILAAVAGERAVQDFLWGQEHDRSHALSDWARLIEERTSKLEKLAFSGNALSCEETVALGRRWLVEIAALALAALEAEAEP
jgi:hypothetical protein